MVFKNKQTQGSTTKTKVLVGLSSILLIVVAVGAYYFVLKNKDDVTNEPATDNAHLIDSLDELEKPENAPSEIQQDENNNPTRNPEYTPPANGQVTITRVENTGSEVVIAGLVQGMESGNCTATYTNGQMKVEASAPIQQGPSYFACQVSIPRSQFTVSGVWKASLIAGSARSESEINL